MQNQTGESCYLKISPETGIPASVRHAYELQYSASFTDALKEARRLRRHYNIEVCDLVEVRMR